MLLPSRLTRPHPSPGDCLDDLLATRFLAKHWSARIWTAGELPQRLARCASNLAPGSEWRAYSADEQVLFAIARLHGSAAAPQSLAIDVHFLDANAAVYSAGVWEHDRMHGWWLDAVLDLSYDCEQGWWQDGLSNPSAANPEALPTPGAILLPDASSSGTRRRR